MKSLMARSSNRAPSGPACGRRLTNATSPPVGRRGHAVDPDHELALAVELAVDLGSAARDPGVMDAGQAGGEPDPGPPAAGGGRRACVGAGTARPTRPMAPSMKTPVGLPSLSRRIWPSDGAFDPSRPSPAAWPRSWPSRRGRRPDGARPAGRAPRASSTAAVGNAPPGQRLWSQFRPVIHESPGVASARALTRRATSSSDATPRRSSSSPAWPRATPCGRGRRSGPGSRRRPAGRSIARGRPAKPIDLRDGADGGDRAVADGQGLGPGVVGIPGPDPPHLDDQLGRAVLLQPQGPARQLPLDAGRRPRAARRRSGPRR